MNKYFEKYDIGLYILLIVQLITGAIWIYLNNSALPWDSANHTYLSLRIAENLKLMNFEGILKSSAYYPIFVHFMLAVLFLIFGPSAKLTQFVALIFLLISIYFVYLYSFQLFRVKKISFFAALVFSCFPIILAQSHWLLLDIPLTAGLLFSLITLNASHHLTRFKQSILFFISLGIILMIKWSGLIFLLVPILITFYYQIKHHLLIPHLKNIVIGTVFLLLIISPWYLTNLSNLLIEARITSQPEAGADPSNLLSLVNFTYYLRSFINSQVSPIAALFFLISIAITAANKFTAKKFLYFQIGLGYLIFTFIGNKDSRYTLPLLPFVAIIISLGLSKLEVSFKTVGKIISFCFIAFITIYFLVLSLRPSFAEGAVVTFTAPLFDYIDIISVRDNLVGKYITNPSPIEQIIADLRSNTNSMPATVLVNVDLEHFNNQNLVTNAEIRNYQRDFTYLNFTSPSIEYLSQNYHQPSFPNTDAIIQYMSHIDYALMSPADIGVTYGRSYQALTQLQKYLDEDTLPDCNKYTSVESPKQTTCYVKTGEKVESTSDLQVEDGPVQRGDKTIDGFSKVYCEWGCTFNEIVPADIINRPRTRFIKSYTLEDGTPIQLFQILH